MSTYETVERDVAASSPLPYKPLSRTSTGLTTIRIFALAPGTSEAPLEGTLIETLFDPKTPSDGLHYECMSYAWGGLTETSDITVDNGKLSVTLNLRAALKRLRLRDRPRNLWIDAICINQKDGREKSQQVGLMQLIYERADRVLVWLGETGEGSDLVFDKFRNLLSRFGPSVLGIWRARQRFKKGSAHCNGENILFWECDNADPSGQLYTQNPLFASLSSFGPLAECLQDWLLEQTQRSHDEKGLLHEPYAEGKLSDRIVDEQSDDDLSSVEFDQLSELAMSLLMDRPFFKRVWVVQEVVVAKKVLVCCGDDELDWWLLNLALAFSLTGPSKHMGLEAGLQRFADITLARQTILARSIRQAAGSIDAIVTLSTLQRHREARATDARDKIYALFGLLKSINITPSVIPDYHLDCRALYINFAKSTLESCENLDLLSIPHGTGLDLPSWVPDWSDSSRLPNCLFVLGQGTPNKHATAKPFMASGNNTLDVESLFSGIGLTLSGLEIDTLDALVDTFRWIDGSELLSRYYRNCFNREMSAQSDPAYDDEVDPRSAEMKEQQRQVIRTLLDFYTVISSWKKLADETTSAGYFSRETAETVLLSTLEGGSSAPGIQETGKRWNHLWKTRQSGIEAATRILDGDETVTGRELYGPVAMPGDNGEHKEWDAPLYGPVNRRRLARTKLGYLALVGPEARQGDAVVLLRGGRTPYIARRRGKHWIFLSDAYVHGIMYGEAWDSTRCQEMIYL